MTNKAFGLGLAVLAGVLSLASAGEPGKAADTKEYPELSRMIHKMVAGQFPKVYEQDTEWGKTIPDPGDLRLPRLRERVQVGDRLELPHGLWRKLRASVNDPAKDLSVRVRSLENKDGVYRLTLDVEAVLRGEMEVVHWQKGLRLLNLLGEGDAVVMMAVECDIKAKPDPKAPFSKVRLEPTVTDVKMSLKEFTLRQVTLRRLGPVLGGEKARSAGEMIKGLVEKQLQSLAPGMKDRFNEGITRSLADGQGTFSTVELLKALRSRPNKE